MKKLLIILFFASVIFSVVSYAQNIDINSIAGKYEGTEDGIESDIEIKFIGNNKFVVEGFAVNWQGHTGDFTLTGEYYNNKIICTDYEYGYILEINIIDKNSFYIKDNAAEVGYFGMNVGFEGKYKRVN